MKGNRTITTGMHRKLSLLFLIAFFSGWLMAQTDEQPVYRLSTANHRAGISFVDLFDPYLSSLNYSGIGVRVELLEQRFLNPDSNRFSRFIRLTGMTARTYNPASTAVVDYLGGNLSWGMQYHYRKIDNLVVLAGAAMEGDYGFKMNSRNVNNPINLDIAFTLNALIGARYFLQTRKRTLQFTGSYEIPFIGMMFVPYPGLSYYELYSSRQLSEAIFFSSLHNRQGHKVSVSLDFPLRRSTIHLGWRYNSLKFQGSGPIYSMKEQSVLLGITYDIFRSSGRTSRFPSHFIRSMY